jgi:uncharacterized protein YbjT (DUF2867 family)
VRCLEANVEPHIEALSGPDTAVDKRLVERLGGSLDPDIVTDRRVTWWMGWGGASLPREGTDRDDVVRTILSCWTRGG